MDFLVHSRARSAASLSAPDEELNERHWSYMDRFADGMTARGPTLAPDRETWTGSMHVVALPSVAAVEAFVAEEPYALAGRFAAHRAWRFTNLLGRTMWEYVDQPGEPRFLVFSHSDLDLPRDRLVVHGELHGLEGQPEGFVAAVQVADRSVLDRLDGAEVHDWEPGGRR